MGAFNKFKWNTNNTFSLDNLIKYVFMCWFPFKEWAYEQFQSYNPNILKSSYRKIYPFLVPLKHFPEINKFLCSKFVMYDHNHDMVFKRLANIFVCSDSNILHNCFMTEIFENNNFNMWDYEKQSVWNVIKEYINILFEALEIRQIQRHSLLWIKDLIDLYIWLWDKNNTLVKTVTAMGESVADIQDIRNKCRELLLKNENYVMKYLLEEIHSEVGFDEPWCDFIKIIYRKQLLLSLFFELRIGCNIKFSMKHNSRAENFLNEMKILYDGFNSWWTFEKFTYWNQTYLEQLFQIRLLIAGKMTLYSSDKLHKTILVHTFDKDIKEHVNDDFRVQKVILIFIVKTLFDILKRPINVDLCHLNEIIDCCFNPDPVIYTNDEIFDKIKQINNALKHFVYINKFKQLRETKLQRIIKTPPKWQLELQFMDIETSYEKAVNLINDVYWLSLSSKL